MEITPNKDFARAMAPMKILSWLVGTWPLQQSTTSAIIRTTFAIIVLLLMFLIVQTEIFLYSIDAGKNLDVIVLIVCVVLAVSKMTYYRVRSDGLISNVVSAVKDYNESKSEEARKIMQQHAFMGKVACAGVIFFSYFGSTVYMAVPTLAGETTADPNATNSALEFPLPSESTIASLNLPESLHGVIFFSEFFMLLVVSTGNLGSDSLFFGIAFHLCGQVEILKLEFSRLGDKSEGTTEHFIALIKRHIYLLKLARMLNNTVSSILVVQLFSSCALICAGGVQCILIFRNFVMVAKTLMILGTLLVQLFAYCYVGEYLMRQMEGVGHSVYFCTWYNISRNVAKDIIHVIVRAQVPVQLMAGRFFVINMETYMSVVKTSLSYFSVIRVMIST